MTAKHIVTCRRCKQKFDINSEPFAKPIERFYYHQKCYDEMQKNPTKEDIKKQEQDKLYQFCKSLFGKDVNYIEITKLAENYIKKYNFTYSGMIGTLDYFYNILGNSTDQAKNSIGIVPYKYEEAKKYFLKKKLAVAAAENLADALDVSLYSPQILEIEIDEPFAATKPIKLFNMEDDE